MIKRPDLDPLRTTKAIVLQSLLQFFVSISARLVRTASSAVALPEPRRPLSQASGQGDETRTDAPTPW